MKGVAGYYMMPLFVSRLHHEIMQIFQGLISLFMPLHSWSMGTGNSPALNVCFQTILCKSVPSMFQGLPQLLEYTLVIKNNTQEILRKNQQGERSRESISKEVHAMHGMMGCAWHSSVSENMCVQNVLEITGGPCTVWALALPKQSIRIRDKCDHSQQWNYSQ